MGNHQQPARRPHVQQPLARDMFHNVMRLRLACCIWLIIGLGNLLVLSPPRTVASCKADTVLCGLHAWTVTQLG
jgi:hypothetical protein